MIIDFKVNNTEYREYCTFCKSANCVTPFYEKNKKRFVCQKCKGISDRVLIIDPKINWWIDDNGVYFHESAGALCVTPSGRILFFELTKFPGGFTIPAGHVDSNEDPKSAVIREVKEEIGIHPDSLSLLVETTIHGDSCRRGSDDHKWSLFITRVPENVLKRISIDPNEGRRPRLVTLESVSKLKLPIAMRYLFTNYYDEIKKAIEEV